MQVLILINNYDKRMREDDNIIFTLCKYFMIRQFY